MLLTIEKTKKMKAKLLVTVLFAACSLSSIAQNIQKFSAGITGGISTGSVRISGVNNHIMDYVQGNDIFGIEGGLFAKVRLKPLYFKPAVMIHYKSGTVDVYNLEGTAYAQSDFKMSRLQVPVSFGINVAGPVNAEAGLVYNHVLSVTSRYNGYNAVVPQNGVGYRVGVNAEFSRLAVGISYQAITNRSTTRGTFESPDDVILSAAYTFGTKPGLAPYGR